MPSFDATCSMVSSMYVTKKPSRSNSLRVSQSKAVKEVNVPGVGTALQTPSGDVRIDYKDGSILTVSIIIFTTRNNSLRILIISIYTFLFCSFISLNHSYLFIF